MGLTAQGVNPFTTDHHLETKLHTKEVKSTSFKNIFQNSLSPEIKEIQTINRNQNETLSRMMSLMEKVADTFNNLFESQLLSTLQTATQKIGSITSIQQSYFVRQIQYDVVQQTDQSTCACDELKKMLLSGNHEVNRVSHLEVSEIKVSGQIRMMVETSWKTLSGIYSGKNYFDSMDEVSQFVYKILNRIAISTNDGTYTKWFDLAPKPSIQKTTITEIRSEIKILSATNSPPIQRINLFDL